MPTNSAAPTQAELQVLAEQLRDQHDLTPLPETEAELERVRAMQRPPGAALAAMIGGAVKAWPPGSEVLHVYALPQITPRLADVLALHRTVDPVLIAPVADQWLHLTLARVDALSPEDPRVEELAAALRETVPRSRPSRIEWVAELSRHGMLVTAAEEDRAVSALMQVAADAVRRVGVQVRQPARPHLSTGYCTPAGAALLPAAVAALSDRLGSQRLELPLAAVVLAWVRQDPEIPTYTWRDCARIDLRDLAAET